MLDDLARGIAATRAWQGRRPRCSASSGTTLFVQTPPGHVVARIARAAHPRARVIALAETGVADAALLVRRAHA